RFRIQRKQSPRLASPSCLAAIQGQNTTKQVCDVWILVALDGQREVVKSKRHRRAPFSRSNVLTNSANQNDSFSLLRGQGLTDTACSFRLCVAGLWPCVPLPTQQGLIR